MKLGILLLSLIPAFSLASGPETYYTTAQMAQAGSYHLTCSNMESIQIHLNVVVNDNKVVGATIVPLLPAKSLQVIEFNEADVKSLTLSTNVLGLKIEGTRPGAMFDEEFSLVLKSNLTGTFKYDTHDGLAIERDVFCGALNHIISPSF